MKRVLSLLWLVALAFISLSGNEVKVVQAFEMIGGSSVSLARSEWKKYLNPDAKVPMEYSIFKVRIKGNADAVKRAKGSFKLDLGSQLMVKDTYTGEDNEIWFLVPAKAKLVYLKCGDGCKECLIWDKRILPDKVYSGEVEYQVDAEISNEFGFAKWIVNPQNIMNDLLINIRNGSKTIYRGHIYDSSGSVKDSLNFITYNVGITYDFEITCNLYKDYHGSFEITKNQEKYSNRVEMKPSYNYIKVESDNQLPVRFTINSDKTAYSSASGKVGPFHPGRYVVHCSQDNYVGQDYTVTLNGDLTTVTIKSQLIHEAGTLGVTSQPENVQVFVDDKLVGVTPYKSSGMPTGRHRVLIKKDGYVTMDTTVMIAKDLHTPVHFLMNSKANVQLIASDFVTFNVSSYEGGRIHSILATGSWTGELPVGKYQVMTSAKDCDDGISTIEVTDKNNVFHIPNPPHKVGFLEVKVYPTDATIYVDGKAYYDKKITLPTGDHSVYATRDGYARSGERTVTIANQTKHEISFNLSNNWVHGVDDHPDHYLELNYGLGFQKGFNHYVGATYSYMPKRFGFNISGLYGINTQEVALTVGPSMRLTNFDSDLSLRLALGGGAVYDIGNNKFSWAADAALQFGFRPENDFAWYSFTLGTKYFNKQFVPTVGVSLIPIRALCLLSKIEEDFPSHRLEAMAGYSFTTKNWRYGFNYSYTQSRLGFYVQSLFGQDNNYSVSAGPTFRLTSSDIPLDLQLYQGIGWIRDGEDKLAGESGLRLAFDNVLTEYFGWWSLNAAFEYAQNGYYGMNFGMSLMPIGGCILLTDVESDFPSNHLEMMAGYGFDSQSWKIGFNYTYNGNTALGAYTQMLFGLDNNYSITVGPVIRLTPTASVVDLQVYQGIGWIRDNVDMIGGETGLRLAFQNANSNGDMGWWSLNCGFEYAQHGYKGINFGVSMGVLGMVITCGLLALYL